MPVAVSIEPFSPSLDMYDSPDPSSAYSLSGHIVISLTQPSSILGLSRPASQSFVLTSLEITFEGQSELIVDEYGYAPLRLISLTKELLSNPVPILADEDRAEWRVVFDLAVPGWLPATSIFGDDQQQQAGISYALYARARFINTTSDLDDVNSLASTPSSSLWANLCAAVRFPSNRPREVKANRVPIVLSRYVSPPPDNEDFPASVFAIHVTDAVSDKNIAREILNTLQLHAIVPSRTSIDDANVSLILRLRETSGDNSLRIHGFEADITEIETFHTSPLASYCARFPLPSAAQQPPVKPLTDPHPMGSLFNAGLVDSPRPRIRITREHSIVPPDAKRVFRVRGGDMHAHIPGVPLDDAWIRMKVDIPVSTTAVVSESPFRSLRHELRVRLSLVYDGERPTSEELTFCLPLEFVKLAQVREAPSIALHLQASTVSLPLPQPEMNTRIPSPTRSLSSLARAATPINVPALPVLPAYSQLFYENGDRKYDGGSLPMYREKEDDEVASSSASESPSSSPSSPLTPSSPFPQDEDESDLDSPMAPLVPPGLAGCTHKFGESFLPLDDDEDDEEAEAEDETVQYGIAY